MGSLRGYASTGSFSFIVKRPNGNNLYISVAPPRLLKPLILLQDYLVPALAEMGAEICVTGAPVENKNRPLVIKSVMRGGSRVVTVAMDDSSDGSSRRQGLAKSRPTEVPGMDAHVRYFLTVEAVLQMLREGTDETSSS